MGKGLQRWLLHPLRWKWNEMGKSRDRKANSAEASAPVKDIPLPDPLVEWLCSRTRSQEIFKATAFQMWTLATGFSKWHWARILIWVQSLPSTGLPDSNIKRTVKTQLAPVSEDTLQSHALTSPGPRLPCTNYPSTYNEGISVNGCVVQFFQTDENKEKWK